MVQHFVECAIDKHAIDVSFCYRLMGRATEQMQNYSVALVATATFSLVDLMQHWLKQHIDNICTRHMDPLTQTKNIAAVHLVEWLR